MVRTACVCFAAVLIAAVSAEAADLKVWAPAQYSPSSGFAPGAEIYKKLTDQFQKENPDITVRYEAIDGGPPGLQRYLAGATSHTLPDAGVVDGEWVARLIQAHVVQPIDQLWPKADQSDFNPDVIAGETFDGKPYAIMFQTGMRGLLYRPSVLKSSGTAKLPTTWTSFLDAAKGLNGKGLTEMLLPAKAVDEPSAIYPISMFWGLGGKLVDEKGAPVFYQGDNGRDLQQVFQFYRDLVANKAMRPGVTVMDEAAIRNFLYSGEAVAIGQSSTNVRQIWTDLPATENDLSLAPLPMPEGKSAVTMLGGFSYALMTTDPDRRKNAWKFIAFMTRADNMGAINDALGQLPVRQSVWKSNQFFSQNPLMQMFKAFYDGPTQMRPSVPMYPAISAAISTEVSEVVAGRVSPEQAVAKARDAVMAEYERQTAR
jgi:multiple sugar transport system substrate-binding protein